MVCKNASVNDDGRLGRMDDNSALLAKMPLLLQRIEASTGKTTASSGSSALPQILNAR